MGCSCAWLSPPRPVEIRVRASVAVGRFMRMPPPPRARSTDRSDEAGLTTLEWLLVVAAVAGLAALAVVLVQNVVGGTAEQVDSSNARQTAADLAVTGLAERWIAEIPTSPSEADEINRRFSRRCRQLGIIYSDISLTVEPYEGTYTGGSGWGPLDKHKPSCHL